MSSVRRFTSNAVCATPVSRGWSGVQGSLSKSRPWLYGMKSWEPLPRDRQMTVDELADGGLDLSQEGSLAALRSGQQDGWDP